MGQTLHVRVTDVNVRNWRLEPDASVIERGSPLYTLVGGASIFGVLVAMGRTLGGFQVGLLVLAVFLAADLGVLHLAARLQGGRPSRPVHRWVIRILNRLSVAPKTAAQRWLLRAGHAAMLLGGLLINEYADSFALALGYVAATGFGCAALMLVWRRPPTPTP
jgi:hypothetical protein